MVTGPPVAANLLEAWEHSRERLDAALELLAGRFVILGQASEGDFFQTDAAALLSAFYSATHQVISSHQNLVAETVGGLDLTELRGPLAGLGTRFVGVRMLTANTELNLRDFSVARIGPRPTDEAEPREVATEVLDLMRRQYRFLRRPGGGPLVSLTAGLDSRITLAAMREMVPETLFFTYEKRYNLADGSDCDMATATELSDHLGLDHKGYTILAADIPRRLKALLRRNTELSHGRAVAASYLRELPADRLHVRSNLYEVARGFYRKKERPQVGPALFAQLISKNADVAPAVVEAFEEMSAVTGILDVPGYDPLDLFYWEFRMGSWFHKVLLESDIAHDTHILFNARVILRLMLSVSARDRVQATVFDHIVDLAWPAVYDLPINGRRRRLPFAAEAHPVSGSQFPL
ncbi:hypothetical protein EV386_2373 [Xylanimonas ulmi]|uniref:Asparagine synthase n=2 Tax=Xylanimonas ulmi TaxID=228973 RepID=A0A4Q7M2E8_9MICO|nr:hypothetical protein EV386_2373 [Xylanibacterium ulmi]